MTSFHERMLVSGMAGSFINIFTTETQSKEIDYDTSRTAMVDSV